MREEIEKKIKELEWRSEVKSILMIEWLNKLLTMLPKEEKKEVVIKKVEVEIPEEKPAKKKISFNKKK